jgi:nitroreductase
MHMMARFSGLFEELTMTEWLQALETRRSVSARLLTGPAPTPDQISTMLRIASRVPDHGKLAPWRFVVIEGEARAALGQIVADIASREQGISEPDRLAVEHERFTRAPLVIAVVSTAAEHPKIPVWEQQLSAGAACMNLLSAAMALGFGACWLTEWMAYDAACRKALGLTEAEWIAGFIHVGHASERPADRPRPELETIVTHWQAQ